MRVGMFTDSYFPQVSGVATSIKVLKDELEAQGHEVIIFTTTDPNVHEDEENIVRLKSIPFLSFKDRRIAIKGFSKAVKEAKKQNIDIVHTHTEFSLGIAGKYVAYMLNIPNVHTYHTMYEKYLHYIAKGKIIKPRNVRTVSRIFCNRTMGVIVPSQLVKEKLTSYDVYKEIRVISTGVEIPDKNPMIRQTIREQLNLSENDLVLLSLSRLAFEKDLYKIIVAFPTVLQHYPNAKLVFVGDGPARETLEELTKDYSLTGSIQFVGEVKNDYVHHYYQMADVYVSASTSETQGLTYLESIVNDCPIVAKRNDYLEEIIRNPLLGRLYTEDENMGMTIVKVIEQLNEPNTPFKVKQKEALLKEISSVTFGKKVISYYKHVIESYYFDSQVEETRSFLKHYKG